ncbi:MAG: hypothetical protein OCD02_23980 [Spirochaetaceae bacterium]
MIHNRKTWGDKHKEFRAAINKAGTYDYGMELFMDLHGKVHSAPVSGYPVSTFVDELWEGLDETTFRESLNDKGRTIAYGLWHSARIEDMCMNLLVIDSEQVIDSGDLFYRLNSSIYDTGNALTTAEILEFSKTINIEVLKEYRKLVGIRTREIVSSLTFKDMKKKILQSGIVKIKEKAAVVDHEDALWLLDYWSNKTIAGILLMPCTRHLMVHLNESVAAKNIKK